MFYYLYGVLVGFCQFDSNLDISGEVNWKNDSIRLPYRQLCVIEQAKEASW